MLCDEHHTLASCLEKYDNDLILIHKFFLKLYELGIIWLRIVLCLRG